MSKIQDAVIGDLIFPMDGDSKMGLTIESVMVHDSDHSTIYGSRLDNGDYSKMDFCIAGCHPYRAAVVVKGAQEVVVYSN